SRMNSDFKDLLRVFNERNVHYLIVGGYAVINYTEPRYTKDLDIWVEASPKNARAVYEALREFGAPLARTSPNRVVSTRLAVVRRGWTYLPALREFDSLMPGRTGLPRTSAVARRTSSQGEIFLPTNVP